MTQGPESDNPLKRLDDWDEFVEARYPEPGQKAKEDYRNYDAPARDTVREFVRTRIGMMVSAREKGLTSWQYKEF